MAAVTERRIAKWEIRICKLSTLGCTPRLSGRCGGDTFRLLTGKPMCQLHPWHSIFFWHTYGEELQPSPEGDASCFLSFLGSNSTFELWLYFPLFTRTVVCDTLRSLVGFWKCRNDSRTLVSKDKLVKSKVNFPSKKNNKITQLLQPRFQMLLPVWENPNPFVGCQVKSMIP